MERGKHFYKNLSSPVKLDTCIKQRYSKSMIKYLADNGEIQAFNIQELLESRNYSFSTAIKYVKDEPIVDLVTKLIRETNYSGLANIDFMLDERDGQAKIVDFNPRFWSSLSGSTTAGINFTLMTCQAALGKPLTSSENASTHYGNIYYMGRSSFNYHTRKLLQDSNYSPNTRNSTDLKERITDPLPEIMRLFSK